MRYSRFKKRNKFLSSIDYTSRVLVVGTSTQLHTWLIFGPLQDCIEVAFFVSCVNARDLPEILAEVNHLGSIISQNTFNLVGFALL